MDRDYVVMLSDWSDEAPERVYAKLKKMSHYYNTRERTVGDLFSAAGYRTIHCGKAHFGAKDTPGENPLNLGFDVNIAGHAPGSEKKSRALIIRKPPEASRSEPALIREKSVRQ